MCGISGYYGNGSEQQLKRAVQALSHRGPDDTGIEFINSFKVGLGHNRLSIIDLSSAGHQPMFNSDNSISIVFNGEIYNFLELRNQLDSKYKFVSNSDTEVIIHAYEEWGIDCLQKLNGMFAFVIYDQKNDLLFGARDRLGEKPLKYYLDDSVFVFASEVKAIKAFLNTKINIDSKAIDYFLTFQYVPAPMTGHENINKLPPAHYFIFKNGSLSIKSYWDVSYALKDDLSYVEWKDLLLSTIESAVKNRLISDVPIGCFLSGGVDSSAVTAFMAKNSSTKIKTFSMGFDDPAFDETKYAQIISQKYNTDHNVLRISSGELLKSFDSIFEYYDEPFADNSALPTYLISEYTRKQVTVALVGDGGDELFAGYDRYNIVDFSRYYNKIPASIRKSIVNNFINVYTSLHQSKLTQRIKKFSNSFEAPFYEKYINYNSAFDVTDKSNLYNESFKQTIYGNGVNEFYKQLFNENLDLVDNSLNFDIHTYLPEFLLYKTDIASMAFALELRAPLLDYKLVELAAKIPASLKVTNFEKKYIFKKMLVEEDILPKEVVYRQKRGFNIPVNSWFKHELKDYVYQTILTENMFTYFDKVALNRYLDTYYSTNLNYDNNIYTLVSLSKFLEKA